MLAELNWIPKSHGGRSTPLSCRKGKFYLPLIRFPDVPPPSGNEPVWSVVVEPVHEEIEESPHQILISYLFPDAPEQELRNGRGFGLYEGPRPVAVGRILAPS